MSNTIVNDKITKQFPTILEHTWCTLAARCYVSVEYVKRTFYFMNYSGAVDPWVAHIINAELDAMCNETVSYYDELNRRYK